MKRTIIIVLVLLIVAAVAAVFRQQIWDFGVRTYEAIGNARNCGARCRQSAMPEMAEHAVGTPLASGTIEARTITVGSVTGGRIAALHVAEGQQVAAGELIAELDTTLVDAALKQAQAAEEAAQAQLALLRAGARPADLAVARAAVAQAETTRDTAYTAWQDALALVDAPGELDVKIATAAAQVQAATEQLAAAQASATAADLEEQLWGRTVKSLEEGFDVPLPFPGGGSVHIPASADKLNTARLQWNLASQKVWDVHAQANSAAVARDAARQTLADLRSQKQDPQTLKAQADAAEAAYRVAQAAVTAAQADLDLVLAGASAEQLEAARALVDQAAGAVRQWQVKRDQARITAPEAGLVTAVVLRVGETAAPGSPIVQLADLSQVTLTVYVPEPELGRVQVGQTMQVAVDSFPGRAFEGLVAQVAGQAEFTPKNVQTREERANTVFAVKISLANPDMALKPGMPADAYDCGLQNTDAHGVLPLCGPLSKNSPPNPQSPIPNPQSAISASGTIEATETTVSVEVGGRVVAVGASEGDQVAAGQLLVQLDEAEVATQVAQAEAAVAAGRAELARVTAPPQAARVAKAEAQVAQAQAGLAGAQTALENARQARTTPQALDAQINSARVQVRQAAAQVDQARAHIKAAEVLQQSVPAEGGSDQDRTRRAIYDQNVIAAQALLRAAQAQQSGAQAALNQLLSIRENPVALEAAVHRAEGQVVQAQAALDVARAALAQVQAPALREAVALAQAKVTQAEAALALLHAQRSKLAVRSPVAGLVTAQAIHAGEVAQPAAPLYAIVDLSQVRLVIYVPTDRLGWVTSGQTAQVSVDAYPDRRFTGVVTHIADQAEFTPKNVQTQEARVRTVFAVEITLDNPDGALRPGMPADAVLGP
jgi:multidrug resistance efflux pump